jgi:hypothetical protein
MVAPFNAVTFGVLIKNNNNNNNNNNPGARRAE